MDSINQALFLALNASANPPTAVVWFAIVCAKYLYFLVPAHMALLYLGGTRFMRFVALAGVVAMAGGILLSGLIGLVAYTPRPSVLGLGHTLLDHRPSASFPSNHAIVCFTWTTVLAIYGRGRLAAGFLVLGLLVAWSRIYLGVHFPLDMVGGAAVAAGLSFAAAKLMTRRGAWLLERCDGLRARVPLLGAAGR